MRRRPGVDRLAFGRPIYVGYRARLDYAAVIAIAALMMVFGAVGLIGELGHLAAQAVNGG